MSLDLVKIALAFLLFWPRGYVLIYLIDRTKSFSFGFKFFAGWLLGLAGFTVDLFAALFFSGLRIGPLAFISSSVMQIFGFSFMIFLFERKIPWPDPRNFWPFIKKGSKKIFSWPSWEKVLLALLILTLAVRIGSNVLQIQSLDENQDLTARSIYSQQELLVENKPLNDSLFKVWLASSVGSYQAYYAGFANLFYYLLLLGFFYFSLPQKISRLYKLIATYLLSSLPFLALQSGVADADLLFSVFLFMTISSIFYYLLQLGGSFYYLAGMGLAFSIWTKNEGMTLILPLMVITTLALLFLRKVRLKDFLLQWFFAGLTVGAWVVFLIIKKINLFAGNFSVQIPDADFFVAEINSAFQGYFYVLVILIFVFIVFKFSQIFSEPAFIYLTLTFVVLFLAYNISIIFFEGLSDFNSLAKANSQLAPLALLVLIFYFNRFFGKINLKY